MGGGVLDEAWVEYESVVALIGQRAEHGTLERRRGGGGGSGRGRWGAAVVQRAARLGRGGELLAECGDLGHDVDGEVDSGAEAMGECEVDVEGTKVGHVDGERAGGEHRIRRGAVGGAVTVVEPSEGRVEGDDLAGGGEGRVGELDG